MILDIYRKSPGTSIHQESLQAAIWDSEVYFMSVIHILSSGFQFLSLEYKKPRIVQAMNAFEDLCRDNFPFKIL